MITCPDCGGVLDWRTDALRCPRCRRAIDCKGVIDLSVEPDAGMGDYDPALFEKLDRAEARHFWFRARRRLILGMFERHARSADHILEIGAGTGDIAAALKAKGFNVAVSDVYRQALEFAGRKGLAERYRFDLAKMPFREHFDVIGMFDVLEHIYDDRAALVDIRQALKPGGRLLMTVPAHSWLWNQSDVVALHKRRYSLKGLRSLLVSAGFEVLEARAFFLSLVPLLALRVVLSPARASDKHAGATGLAVVPVANEILSAILTLDNLLTAWLRPSVGGSIAVIARRNE